MSNRGASGRVGNIWGRFWRGGALRRLPDVPRARSRSRRVREDQQLTVETLEIRATVSDVFLSLLWSAAPAIWIADPVSGANGSERPALHRQTTSNSLTMTPEQPEAVTYRPASPRDTAGARATPAVIGHSSATAIPADPFAVSEAEELAPALASLHPPPHAPSGSGPLADTTPAAGSASGEGNAGGNPSGSGVVVSGGSLAVSSVNLPGNGQGEIPPPPKNRGFKASWVAGETDDAGNLTGGTELMNMVAHGGKLYAGTSVWKDDPGDGPVLGPQVLRLDSPKGRWQVDLNLSQLMDDGTPRYLRISALTSVTFTTDVQGHALTPPVSMLLAAPADNAGTLSVFSRDDTTGTWTEMDVFPAGIPAGFRSFGFHHDTRTNVDRVFAGTGIFGIFNGAYDPAAPGRIRWNPVPQLIGLNRPMAFAEVNNVLYVAIDPGIYARTDGALAHWDMVYQFTDPPYQSDGLRGLTAVPSPSGDGDVLLESLEGYLGYVGYIDPAAGYTSTEELHFLPYFIRNWGGLTQPYVVAAYNDVTPLQDPKTGETLELIGLEAQSPVAGHANSSWYLVRHLDGSYDLHEIPPIATPENPDPSLFATRAIVLSPFPEDQGKIVYFGGYDASWDTTDHNTAWIYRASLSVALRG